MFIDEGGCGGAELGGDEDLEFELGSTSFFASSFLEIGEEAVCFGAAKNEVIVAFALGFLELEPATSAALRFKEVDILRIERMLAVQRFCWQTNGIFIAFMGQSCQGASQLS